MYAQKNSASEHCSNNNGENRILLTQMEKKTSASFFTLKKVHVFTYYSNMLPTFVLWTE